MYLKLIVILNLMMATCSFAGNLPQAASVEQFCSGLSISTPAGNSNKQYFALWTAGGTATTASRAYHLWKDGVKYSIASGTYFHAKCVCSLQTGASGGSFTLLSATADYTDGDTLASLTGPVYMSGSAQAQTVAVLATFGTEQCHMMPYNFGSGSSTVYPGMTGVSAGTPNTTLYIIGYESNNAVY